MPTIRERQEVDFQERSRERNNGWKEAVVYICDHYRQRIDVLRAEIAEDQWGWESSHLHEEIAYLEKLIKHHMENVF